MFQRRRGAEVQAWFQRGRAERTARGIDRRMAVILLVSSASDRARGLPSCPYDTLRLSYRLADVSSAIDDVSIFEPAGLHPLERDIGKPGEHTRMTFYWRENARPLT